ncbi:MAG: DinB family protein [Gemmatimonadaceae bacterium]
MNTTRALLILSVALPLGLAEAQAPAGPPPNPMATAYRSRTGNLRRNIAQAFDSIPESKFGYKPTPAQLSFGYIAAHIASDSYLFCNNYSDRKATVADNETTPDSVKQHWPKDVLVTRMKASFTFCDEVMAGLDDAAVAAIITVSSPNGTTRQVARVNYLIGHAIDLADHYSQIANYMRINGMLPPTALPRPGRGGNE